MKFVVLLVSGLLWAAAARAQPAGAPADDPYRAGLECFAQLDYACAVDLLTAAAFATTPADRTRWIDIHRKLAESQLALGHSRQAVEAFGRLLEADPGYRIEAAGTSPKILAALAEARALRKPAAPPPPAPAPAVGWSAERSLRLGLGGSAEFLVGRDADLLQVGFALDLSLLYRYAEHWLLGGGLRWAAHELAQGGQRLHLGAAWVGAGPLVELGPVQLAGRLGLGLAGFGLLEREGRSALLVPLQLSADFRLHDRLAVGLAFSPSWVLSFGDFSSSWTFDLGLRAQLAF